MKNIVCRIISAIFPPRRNYIAEIAYSGLLCHVCIEAANERRARAELNKIADGGCVVSFVEA